MSPEDLRGWDHYPAKIRSLRITIGAFLLASATLALMSLDVQVQLLGVLAATLIIVFCIALLSALPLFARVSRINATEAHARGGHQINDSLPLLRTIVTDVLRGRRA
jgi:hypothetical protein